MMDLKTWVRPNIWNLKPYSSARSEFKGEASVFLDANENPYNAPYNRYPDPLQWAVKEKISQLKGVPAEQIFLGVGSDEPIDLIYRAFCEPGIDNVVAIDPTYGMYQVCADINNVEYRKVSLDNEFNVDADAVLNAIDTHTKAVFVCSPNNPTGNSLNRAAVERILKSFAGVVVVDEAYIDFSSQPTFLHLLNEYANLVVLQTFSKAWGSAGIRLGMAFASREIIEIFNKIKYPYNINKLTQEHALSMLEKAGQVKEWVTILLQERVRLASELSRLSIVKKVYPSDANFLLVKVDDASAVYRYLVENGIIVRNRNNITLCMGCLRITVGTPEENRLLIEAMTKL
ncbi:MAG: histidinol-phosphate transaminase [Bacteroidaceae bacterium]|nr:histidinol-phosphate transaminase [Bacteroidaceae bacterium]